MSHLRNLKVEISSHNLFFVNRYTRIRLDLDKTDRT